MKKRTAFFLLALALLLHVGLMPMSAHAAEDHYLTIDSTNFPDTVFRQYMKDELAYGKNYMTKEEVEDVTSIDVSEMEIESLKGIENFPMLEVLNCGTN